MPSRFEQIYRFGRAVLQQQHGRPVTWRKADGTDVAISNAIVGPESSEPRDSDQGELLCRVRTLELPVTLVPDPNRGDSVIIDEVEWGFDYLRAVEGGLAHVQVIRPEQAEITHIGYRNQV